MALQDYRVDIDGCAKCGSCRIIFDDPSGPLGRPRCPSGAKYVFDSYYAAGRMEIARGLQLIQWKDLIYQQVVKGDKDLEKRCMDSLFENDTNLTLFNKMDPDTREREKFFIANSIKGFVEYLREM